jgi:endonuclease/exonuclease/phosphatase family metal-dependent hydrolase
MTVRVVSFNLLVPIYAGADVYIQCQPRFLATNYRWNLIESHLEEEITHHENTIICLQELSLVLLPKLELFFHRHNYILYRDLYGNRRNDYMGVGIAIPRSMQLNSISYIKMGDHLRSVAKPHATQSNLLTWVGNLWWQFVWSKFSKPVSDPWKLAIDRSNTLICLQVTIAGKSLCIGTYHMPCAFQTPDVMIIHSSVVKDLMFQFAGGENMILAGDFNSKPTDMAYQVLTERGYVDGTFPKSDTYNIAYQPNGEQILKSAYREKNGVEPAFTNHVDTASAPKFRATLDYIFFDGRLRVEGVRKLPDKPKSASYPDDKNPSDHLMIAASFRLL